MNKIINKCLLTADKFMPKLHLIQTGFTKHYERIKKFRKIGNLKNLLEMN